MKRFLFPVFCLVINVQSWAQQPGIIFHDDFEKGTSSWTSPELSAVAVSGQAHSGTSCLQLRSGGRVSRKISLQPAHLYQLSVWLKTASGSDEIQVKAQSGAVSNVSVASALTDWAKIEKEFRTDADQNNTVIEIYHPQNAGNNSAWADDLVLTDLGPAKTAKASDIRPLPERVPQTQDDITQQPNDKVKWLIDARFGMFIHWGLYAGPGKGEWYMENAAVPIDEYRKLAYPSSGDVYFDADKFDANEWAELAKQAGMQYMCLTTMHHDGYALFDSWYMNAFTSKQTHNRDFVSEYTDACRKAGLKVGLYKTLINWRYPGYYDVNGTGIKPNKWGYVTDSSHRENARLMKEGLFSDVKQLMTQYGKIDMIFWDGGWLGQQGSDADAAYFWEPGKYLNPDNNWPVNDYFRVKDPAAGKALGLMGMVRKYQPDIIVNPRSGWMGDFESEEGSAPVTGPVRTKQIWQKCMSVGGAWGYSPAMEDSSRIISFAGIKRMLADVTIRNMSLLLNVGPDRHGVISKAVAHLLQRTGDWLKQHAEAIYGTYGGPWNPKDGQYGFAYRDSTIYVFLLDDFKGNTLTLPSLNRGQRVVQIYEVGNRTNVRFSQNSKREVTLEIPDANDNIRIIALKLNKNVLE